PVLSVFHRSARRESNPRLALIRSLLSPLSYEPFTSPSRFAVGPEGIEPSPARLKVCCAAFTPRPRNQSEDGISIVVSSFRSLSPTWSGPPGRNRGGQNRTALSRAPATTAHRGGARRVTINLHPASQNGRIRTGGLLAPSQADFQALPRSEF